MRPGGDNDTLRQQYWPFPEDTNSNPRPFGDRKSCSMFLPHGAVGWSAVYVCGIDCTLAVARPPFCFDLMCKCKRC